MADVPPLVAIKEANTHLQALHERNVFLEQEVVNLRSMLSMKQQQEERLLGQTQLIEEKDMKIKHLENEIDRLVKQSKENTKKDLVITQLTRKVQMLNEILKYKSALESITDCLEQVEQDFIVDIDNLVNLSTNGISINESSANGVKNNDSGIDTSKLSEANETIL